MIIELKPEQGNILRRAIESGRSQEDALEKAFALLAEQFEMEDWLSANKEVLSEQIDRAFAQSERGEVHGPEEARRILKERRAKREVA